MAFCEIIVECFDQVKWGEQKIFKKLLERTRIRTDLMECPVFVYRFQFSDFKKY